ncbi:MAG: alpha-glucosidase/alpha-galactosidase [Candidatus Lokiarchaeota archaeon]|nr:alpha-glucosidase/alpha-galactosidase [Candidatus Lokiarchaeota archaeon]
MIILKVAFIGAGSIVFGENILTDMLTFPSIQKDTVIYLEDINEHRLDLMYNLMNKYKELNPKVLEGVTFEKTTNLKKAITDAKFIISAIHVGGLDAFQKDIEIPWKYGVSQCIGDSLGPGGVFRFLRNAPVLKQIVELINEVGFNSESREGKPLFLNYTNPMVMNVWYCNSINPDSTVGLCHGVQGTSMSLRNWIGVRPENYSFLCAGINHMAWFLELWYRQSNSSNAPWKNAYPLLYKKHEANPNIIGGDLIRWDMMEATGYFMTESSGHLSEYLPYYRKRSDLLEKYKGIESGHDSLLQAEDYRMQVKNALRMERQFERRLKSKRLSLKKVPSYEYGSHIINAIETDSPFKFNGNVMNKDGSLITNLPKDCCVEIPIFADYHGLHPQGGINLPTVCQGLCISNIMVQKAAVEGQLTLDKERIYHAILLDPNTASVCSPKEIRDMVDEMFEAEKQWLPQFNGS